MKRLFITCLLAASALIATGCPMYADTGCESELDCGPGYACHAPSGACVRERPDDGVTRCHDDGDCDDGESCDRYGRCVADGAGGENGSSGGGAGSGGAGGGAEAGAAGASPSAGGDAGAPNLNGSAGAAGDGASAGGASGAAGGGDAANSGASSTAAGEGGISGRNEAGAGG